MSFYLHLFCEQSSLFVLFADPFPRGQLLASISSTFIPNKFEPLTLFWTRMILVKNPHCWPFPKGPKFYHQKSIQVMWCLCHYTNGLIIYTFTLSVMPRIRSNTVWFRIWGLPELPFFVGKNIWTTSLFLSQTDSRIILFEVPKLLFDLSWFKLIFCSNNRQAC